MKNRSEKSGFTLVELLVVIVIIAILAGLLLPAIVGALNNTKKTACGNNLGQLWKQMMNYQIQYGGTSKIMPIETGENFWKALTLTNPPMQKSNDDVYVCAYKGPPAVNNCDYRGPVGNVNTTDKEDPVGADKAANHNSGATSTGGNVLKRDGSVNPAGATEPLWITTNTKTR